ncbi:MAG: restriction endonuclease subunit S [Desulfobacterales bacterium]
MRKDKWELVKLGGICEIDPSKRELADIASDTLVSFAEMADLNEKRPYFNFSRKSNLGVLKKGGLSYFKDADVLLAKMTPCFENGKSGLVAGCLNGIGFGSTEFFVLRGVKIDPYLLYSIISSDFFIDSGKLMMLGTTGRKRLMKDFVANYQIPLPPLEEQKQIAALFQSIDTAIEQVEVQEKNLKALQKTLSNGLVSKKPVFGNLLSDKNCNLCKFEDITDCIEKHDKKPLESGITRFVGLEFIEAENFNLQGFGDIEKGTTFTKRFAKGDVLFGKRRAYLKKVAVADFDGICSGDILVFRANKTRMLPELLPYYVSSDAFIQHAVSTSAGSLSPRTKWRDLAVLEISIPDLKTQKEIVEVFRYVQLALDQLKQQKTTLKNLKQKLLSEILG